LNGKKITVRVPGSTSNLGPGFDALGLALSIYNEVTLEVLDVAGEPVVEIQGEGAGSLPRTRENLVVRAASAVLAGRERGKLKVSCINMIPLARGLGSSAAAAVAGIFAANALLGKEGLTREQLLEYAVALEGHPDNVAPSIFGGLVACVKSRKQSQTFPLKAHKDLAAAVCVPEFELLTSKSRSVLPETYLRADAVDNCSRALVLGSALERGLWDRLPAAMEDRFHQPYRAPLVKGLTSVIRAANAEGCGAALSGAGPCVIALDGDRTKLERAGVAMMEAFKKAGVESKVLLLDVDRKGVQVSKA
jgi:homoserine kinase